MKVLYIPERASWTSALYVSSASSPIPQLKLIIPLCVCEKRSFSGPESLQRASTATSEHPAAEVKADYIGIGMIALRSSQQPCWHFVALWGLD